MTRLLFSTAMGARAQASQAYRDILQADPKNVRAATELANHLYDAGRFGEAVTYYQQVFAAEPTNVNVSTDLGTALWYSGKPDEALAQFKKSLAIEVTLQPVERTLTDDEIDAVSRRIVAAVEKATGGTLRG